MLLLSAKSTAKVYSEMPNGVFPKNHVSNPPPNVNDIHLRHAADGGTFFEAEIARLKNSRQAPRAKEQFRDAASRLVVVIPRAYTSGVRSFEAPGECNPELHVVNAGLFASHLLKSENSMQGYRLHEQNRANQRGQPSIKSASKITDLPIWKHRPASLQPPRTLYNFYACAYYLLKSGRNVRSQTGAGIALETRQE